MAKVGKKWSLTESQKQLAEKNHDLIYSYLNYYNLSADEYYDILCIALCYICKNYNDKKGNFSTYAFRGFNYKIYNIWAYNHRKKREVKEVDYIDNEEFENFKSENQDIERIEDKIDLDILLKQIKKKLNAKQYNVVELYSKGKTFEEIGKTTNTSKQNVNELYHKAIKKLRSEFNVTEKEKGTNNKANKKG